LKRTSYFRVIYAVFLISMLFPLPFISGCSEDESVAPEEPNPYVSADMLICNPLAPAPGEVTTLTLETSGFSPGELPDVYWTVEAGSLFVKEGISVQWKAPDTTGVFLIKARTTVGGVTDTTSRYVMVRNFVKMDTGLRVSLYPYVGSNGIMYFVGTDDSPTSNDFMGYHVYKYVPGNSEILTEHKNPDFEGGQEFSYHGDRVLGTYLSEYSVFYRNQSYNVAIFPLFGFSSPRLVTNDTGGAMKRKNQYLHPWGTDDLSMIVWQENIVGTEEDGTKDLINIAFDNNLTKMTLTTNYDSIWFVLANGDSIKKARYYRNIKPMITPDKDYIIYFVDTTGTFEPCLIPIVGGVPDTNQSRALMVDESHGLFEVNGIRIDENTIFEFNPTNTSIVAFIDAPGHLCFFDYQAEDVQIVQLEGKAEEFVWSPDGELCAVITGAGINIVNVSGSGGLVLPKERSYDKYIGVNWAPDAGKRLLGFRMLRKGKSELDTYSALVLYSVDENKWYYASPRVGGTHEPSVPFTWFRVIFRGSSDFIYAPMPVIEPGREVMLFYSYN